MTTMMAGSITVRVMTMILSEMNYGTTAMIIWLMIIMTITRAMYREIFTILPMRRPAGGIRRRWLRILADEFQKCAAGEG